jgi:hypothetical protein
MRLPFDIRVHAVVELVAGLILVLLPLLLAFPPLGLIVTVLLGVILTGSALGLTTDRHPSMIVHAQFDSLFTVVAALAALGLAVAGQPAAAILLSATVALQAVLGLGTRYALID